MDRGKGRGTHVRSVCVQWMTNAGAFAHLMPIRLRSGVLIGLCVVCQVCTLASNWCRLIDELRVTVGGKVTVLIFFLSSSFVSHPPVDPPLLLLFVLLSSLLLFCSVPFALFLDARVVSMCF